MAVTIDEMHVDVQAPPPNASAAKPEPKKPVDLSEAMEILQERKLRLRAD